MCGSDKALGSDGFSSYFVKKIWYVLKPDIMAYVNKFFRTEVIPNGCNASFITLIPKIQNPILVKDFQSISLIGV